MSNSLYSPTELKMMAMCEEYSKGQRTVAQCCQVVGISVAQHRKWLADSEWYRTGWQFAEELYQQHMESLLDDRIRNGAVDIKTTFTIITNPETGEIQKIPVEEVQTRRFSDTLLLKFLAAKNPEEFGKQQKKEQVSNIAERLISGRARVAAAAEGDNASQGQDETTE